MPKLISTGTMIQKLSGLLGTQDLSAWEQEFVASLLRRMDAGEVTKLSDKQVETLDRLHSKHFA